MGNKGSLGQRPAKLLTVIAGVLKKKSAPLTKRILECEARVVFQDGSTPSQKYLRVLQNPLKNFVSTHMPILLSVCA